MRIVLNMKEFENLYLQSELIIGKEETKKKYEKILDAINKLPEVCNLMEKYLVNESIHSKEVRYNYNVIIDNENDYLDIEYVLYEFTYKYKRYKFLGLFKTKKLIKDEIPFYDTETGNYEDLLKYYNNLKNKVGK